MILKEEHAPNFKCKSRKLAAVPFQRRTGEPWQTVSQYATVNAMQQSNILVDTNIHYVHDPVEDGDKDDWHAVNGKQSRSCNITTCVRVQTFGAGISPGFAVDT